MAALKRNHPLQRNYYDTFKNVGRKYLLSQDHDVITIHAFYALWFPHRNHKHQHNIFDPIYKTGKVMHAND